MGKIRGKFAPLMDELAEDERWLLECDDHQKLLYQLIMFTIYTTNGTAPDNARYYQVRYHLQRRIDRLTSDLERIKRLFPKLLSKDKKLSLANSVTYKNTVVPIGYLEEEKEVEEELEVEEEKEKESVVFVSAQKEQKPEFNQKDAFKAIWLQYPEKGRFEESVEQFEFSKTVVSRGDFLRILKALEKYLGHLKANSWKNPKNFKNWLEEWDFWERWEEPRSIKKMAEDSKIDLEKWRKEASPPPPDWKEIKPPQPEECSP